MWTWIPAFATASFAARYSVEGSSGSLVAFAAIASGAVGCIAAGLGGDTFGKARIARLALITSAACAATSWLFFGAPTPVLLLFVVVWGFSVVADSGAVLRTGVGGQPAHTRRHGADAANVHGISADHRQYPPAAVGRLTGWLEVDVFGPGARPGARGRRR